MAGKLRDCTSLSPKGTKSARAARELVFLLVLIVSRFSNTVLPSGRPSHIVLPTNRFFLDFPVAKADDAVRVLFAEENVRVADLVAAPGTDDTLLIASPATLTLGALVRVKLSAFRDKDRMRLRGMLDVVLIGHTWPA